MKKAKNSVAAEVRRAGERPLASTYVPEGWTGSEVPDSGNVTPSGEEPPSSPAKIPRHPSKPSAKEIRMVGERLETTRRAGMVSNIGLVRLLYMIDRSEVRVNYVLVEGEKAAEAENSATEARPIKDDWLDRFFRYVAEVDEQEVLDVLAKGLSEAASREKPLLSPRALDALRFFQKDSLEVFRQCAGLLTVLGYVPLGFFDDEDAELGSMDLELLLESGLVKVETMSYYALPLGDFLLNFSYQQDERFVFEIVRLTQIGREIAGLINNILREVPAFLQKPGVPGQLLQFQLMHGVSQEIVGRVAQALLRSMSNRWSIDTTLFLKTGKSNRRIAESSRPKFEVPFGLTVPEKVGNESDGFMTAVVDVFKDFDENQLPAFL